MHAGQYLCVCFFDSKSAYSRVSRPVLWQILQHLGLSSMLQAVKHLYDTAAVASSINEQGGEPLESVSGVKKGYPLSPTCLESLLMACTVSCWQWPLLMAWLSGQTYVIDRPGTSRRFLLGVSSP